MLTYGHTGTTDNFVEEVKYKLTLWLIDWCAIDYEIAMICVPILCHNFITSHITCYLLQEKNNKLRNILAITYSFITEGCVSSSPPMTMMPLSLILPVNLHSLHTTCIFINCTFYRQLKKSSYHKLHNDIVHKAKESLHFFHRTVTNSYART